MVDMQPFQPEVALERFITEYEGDSEQPLAQRAAILAIRQLMSEADGKTLNNAEMRCIDWLRLS